jgi:hypothetical protein
MTFTPAHSKVIHNVECDLHVNRKAVRKLESILEYLKEARMVAPTEQNAALKMAVLIVMNAQIEMGDCTSNLCRFVRVAGKVVLA